MSNKPSLSFFEGELIVEKYANTLKWTLVGFARMNNKQLINIEAKTKEIIAS